jgi:hypothetical protein
MFSASFLLTVIGKFISRRPTAKMPRLQTRLGKTYLERLQLAFERIKPSIIIRSPQRKQIHRNVRSG